MRESTNPERSVWIAVIEAGAALGAGVDDAAAVLGAGVAMLLAAGIECTDVELARAELMAEFAGAELESVRPAAAPECDAHAAQVARTTIAAVIRFPPCATCIRNPFSHTCDRAVAIDVRRLRSHTYRRDRH
jgi:hypothetical protein